MSFICFVWGCIANIAGAVGLFFGHKSLVSTIAASAYLIAGSVLIGAALICREIEVKR